MGLPGEVLLFLKSADRDLGFPRSYSLVERASIDNVLATVSW